MRHPSHQTHMQCMHKHVRTYAHAHPNIHADRLVGLVVKASASSAEGPWFKSRSRRDFFGAESYQWLKNWHSSGYPARRLAL